MTAQNNTLTGSLLCLVLEGAWKQLCLILPELPLEVVIVPAAGGSGRRTVLGHFAPSIWHMQPNGKAEVRISPQVFDTPADALLVMLHEAAHGILYARKHSGGCSPNGTYHRVEFRNACREIGLRCDFEDARYGWNRTLWPEGEVPQSYQDTLRYLKENLPSGYIRQHSIPSTPGNSLPPPGRIMLICGCGRRLYAARSVAKQGAIVCTLCGMPFSTLA